jgi:ribosomal protein S18 acetylase RimI-like enzyme
MTDVVQYSGGDQCTGARVRPAEPSDLPAVADVHAVAFPGYFLADMGRPFLVAYYRAVLDYGPGVFLVVEERDGIAGFVAGFPDLVAVRQHMWRRKWRLAVPVCMAVLRNPRLLKRIVRRSHDVMSTRKEAPRQTRNEYELSPLAVHPKQAGRGLGKLLVNEFIKAATSRGAESVRLNTNANHNERVNQFFRNLGFELTRTFDVDGQRPMNEYVMSTHLGSRGNTCES